MTSIIAISPIYVDSSKPPLSFARNQFVCVFRALSLLSRVWRWLSISGLPYLFAPEYGQVVALRHSSSFVLGAAWTLGGPGRMT